MAESATTPRTLIRRALPTPVVDAIKTLRELGPGSRVGFVRVWLRRVFRQQSLVPADLPAAPRLLFVCHGNILRSALAQAVWTEMVRSGNAPAGSEAESAGTGARDGSPADPRGVGVARDMGLNLDTHRALRLNDLQVARADMILVMDFVNEADVVSRFPHAAGKVRLLGAVAEENGRPIQIRDPYDGSMEDVRNAFAQIAAAVGSLATTLSLAGRAEAGNSP
jgi:protein-tyrosine-phosphatase